MSHASSATGGAVRKGFGSFHSADVEVLIAQDEGSYEAPPVPPAVLASLQASSSAGPPAFGAEARERWFMLDPEWAFVNHGAFGAVMRPGFEAAAAWRLHCERQPLRFLDRELMPQLVAVLRRVAAHVGADPRRLAPVPNATAGLNAVVRSFPLAEGDAVLSLDVGYGAVKKLLRDACARAGASHVELPVVADLAAPDLGERVVAAVRAHLAGPGGARTRLAVFDYVTSNTAVRMPVEALARACREAGVAVLVDGAHSLGQYERLALDGLGVDFFVANAHKWLAAPKGAAVLYVRSEAHRAAVRPPVVSHGHGAGFLSEFVWQGLQDYSPLLALPAVLDAWRAAGQAAALDYMRGTLDEAVRLLCGRWGTEPLLRDEGARAACMALVRVPGPREPRHSDEHNELQDRLHFEHSIEVPVKKVPGHGLYVRVSAHLYNTARDYERLAEAMLALRGDDAAPAHGRGE